MSMKQTSSTTFSYINNSVLEENERVRLFRNPFKLHTILFHVFYQMPDSLRCFINYFCLAFK